MSYLGTTTLQEGLNTLMETFPPVTFTWSGADYSGLDAVPEPIFDVLSPGGVQGNDLRTLFVPRYQTSGETTFPADTPPEPGDAITIAGVSYTIKRRLIAQPGLTYTFEVEA